MKVYVAIGAFVLAALLFASVGVKPGCYRDTADVITIKVGKSNRFYSNVFLVKDDGHLDFSTFQDDFETSIIKESFKPISCPVRE